MLKLSVLRRVAATLATSARAYSGQGAASSQPWLDLGKGALPARALLLSTGAVCTAAGSTLCFAYYYSEAGVTRHMCRVFEAGGARGWETHFRKDWLPGRVERAKVHADISKLLRPDAKAQYVVIVGAAGTGKSTAVRKAIVDLEEPKGAVYFLPPTLLIGFSSALANALGFYRPVGWADRMVRFFSGETKEVDAPPPSTAEPHATWQTLEPHIVRAAERYAAKHDAPAVLVLDGMDLVAKDDPAFFNKIQDFAKKCADTGILSVVLVVSDGRALPLLQSSSAITRTDTIYEVGDVSDADAIAWLKTVYNVEACRAEALVHAIAGGRFPLLIMSGSSTSKTVDAIIRELDIKARDNLRKAGVRATAPLFWKLLSSSCIDIDAAHDLLPESKVQELLRLNILSAHPDGTYTFYDRHVARFMERATPNRRRWW